MNGLRKIAAGVAFSVLCTAIGMAALSLAIGPEDGAIPPIWWGFGLACPALVSLPVCIILVRQGEANRRLAAQLESALSRLADVAQRDGMTGLLNRTAFLARAGALPPGLAWMLVTDIDRFKSINDRHGHPVGDRVIQSVASTLARTIRSDDLCGRMGGEEFAILACGLSEADAHQLAERLRGAVASLTIECDGITVRPTISLGLAPITGADGIAEALRLADAAMYRSKRAGRNRVSLAA